MWKKAPKETGWDRLIEHTFGKRSNQSSHGTNTQHIIKPQKILGVIADRTRNGGIETHCVGHRQMPKKLHPLVNCNGYILSTRAVYGGRRISRF